MHAEESLEHVDVSLLATKDDWRHSSASWSSVAVVHLSAFSQATSAVFNEANNFLEVATFSALLVTHSLES